MQENAFSRELGAICSRAVPGTEPLIAVSSCPRVGSMWTYNVARALVRHAGLTVVPEHVPWRDGDKLDVAGRHVRNARPEARCLIKTHFPLFAADNLRVIYCRRNLRDSIYSQCRFTGRTLDASLARELVTDFLLMDRHYSEFPPDRLLIVGHADIVADSHAVLRRIAAFIGIEDPDGPILDRIGVEFGKEAVRLRTAALQRQLVLHAAGYPADEGVRIVNGRAYELATGFQSGHVAERKSGSWRRDWTREQREIVDEAIRTVEASLS